MAPPLSFAWKVPAQVVAAHSITLCRIAYLHDRVLHTRSGAVANQAVVAAEIRLRAPAGQSCVLCS